MIALIVFVAVVLIGLTVFKKELKVLWSQVPIDSLKSMGNKCIQKSIEVLLKLPGLIMDMKDNIFDKSKKGNTVDDLIESRYPGSRYTSNRIGDTIQKTKYDPVTGGRGYTSPEPTLKPQYYKDDFGYSGIQKKIEELKKHRESRPTMPPGGPMRPPPPPAPAPPPPKKTFRDFRMDPYTKQIAIPRDTPIAHFTGESDEIQTMQFDNFTIEEIAAEIFKLRTENNRTKEENNDLKMTNIKIINQNKALKAYMNIQGITPKDVQTVLDIEKDRNPPPIKASDLL